MATFGSVLTMLSLIYYIFSLTEGRFYSHKYSSYQEDTIPLISKKEKIED